MKTSYFYKLGKEKINGAVSISLSKPRYVKVPFEYKKLAPTWKLLSAYKKGYIDDAEYETAFREQLDKLNPYDVLHELKELVGEDVEPVIMCHCGKDKFCHRHIVAEWLFETTGEQVDELGYVDTRRKGGKIC